MYQYAIELDESVNPASKLWVAGGGAATGVQSPHHQRTSEGARRLCNSGESSCFSSKATKNTMISIDSIGHVLFWRASSTLKTDAQDSEDSTSEPVTGSASLFGRYPWTPQGAHLAWCWHQLQTWCSGPFAIPILLVFSSLKNVNISKNIFNIFIHSNIYIWHVVNSNKTHRTSPWLFELSAHHKLTFQDILQTKYDQIQPESSCHIQLRRKSNNISKTTS